MKRNAIVRIVIFSIIIVLLLGILASGLGLGVFVVNFDLGSDDYTTVEGAEESIFASDIRCIDIEWAAGSIEIQTADTDTISFSENGVYTEDQRMVWKQEGDTLTICYQKPSLQIGFLSISKKDLTVTVPKNWTCSEFSLDIASAKVTMNGMEADEVNITTASGTCEFLNCTIEDLDIDTASGAIRYEGSLNTLDCDAASASFVGEFTNVPRKLQMDSASGDLDIMMPENCGFRVTMDALSGKFDSDFPAMYDGNSYIYGDESCIIDFDGASGSVKIRKAA